MSLQQPVNLLHSPNRDTRSIAIETLLVWHGRTATVAASTNR